jgi:16S rRNA (adenine1518-N6/adenine1519-N6)-dimethyltransferase
MKLSDIKTILATAGIQLSKSMGQNFLHDGNQLRRIAAAAALSPEDQVLEIGPGLGPLTELLLAQAGQVLAIEVDERLVAYLRQRWPDAPRLQLLRADALEYLQREKADWSGWKLVANLPYSVASPILVELARTEAGPRLMTVTVQWEVARRLAALPDTADYGVLSLLVQLRYQPRESFRIPTGCFYPPPNVDSACITLVRRPHVALPPAQADRFVRLVKRSFSQRRKMMLKLLKADYPLTRLEAAFAQLRLSPLIRAECLSLDQFVQLTQILHAEGG